MKSKIFNKMNLLYVFIFIMFIVQIGCGGTGSIKLGETGKTLYYVGEDFDTTGYTIVFEKDGEINEFALTDDLVSYDKFLEPKSYDVLVTYIQDGNEYNYTIKVEVKENEKNVKEISVKEIGKDKYVVGDIFDPSGYVISIIYENGNVEDTSLTNEMISHNSLEFKNTGSYEIEVLFEENIKTKISVEVSPLKLVSVSINKEGKTSYFQNDTFDVNGFTLHLVYNNGLEKDINLTTDMVVSNYVLSDVNNKEVIIKYEEGEVFSLVINVQIEELIIESVSIVEEGQKEYFIGDLFNPQNYIVKYSYTNGRTENKPLSEEFIIVNDVTFDKLGTNEIKYSLIRNKDIQLSISVNVSEVLLKSISVSKEGNKNYYVGDTFDVNGYYIKCSYNNNTEKEIPLKESMIDNVAFTSEKDYVIVISYTENDISVKTELTIHVSMPNVVDFEMVKKGQDIYSHIVPFDISSYEFMVTYSNNKKEIVANKDIKIKPYVFEENVEDDPVSVNIYIEYSKNGKVFEEVIEVYVIAEWDYEEYEARKEVKEISESVINELSQVFVAETETDLPIPRFDKYGYNVVIVLSSSDTNIISLSGVVNRKEENRVVTMTITIRNQYETITHSWDILVKGLGPVVLRPWVDSEKHIFAYFYEGTSSTMSVEDARRVDVINYCFARISNGKVDVSGLKYLTENLKLRRSTGVRVVLSVGGGGKDAAGAYSSVCADENTRKEFVQSMMDVIKEYGMDGIDLDWEYPSWDALGALSKPEDKRNFTILCKEIREAMDAYKDGLLLTAALIGGFNVGRFYEVKEIDKYLDYAHIMTYDGNSSGYATHHCSPYKGNTYASCDEAVKVFLGEGMRREKMVVGAAFYGKISTLNTKTTASTAVLGKPTGDPKTITYTKIFEEYLSNPSFKKLQDPVSRAYFLTDGETFITYDDPNAIRIKCDIIKANGLAGIMFWDYGSDKTGNLLREVKSGIDAINTGR